MFKGSPDKMDLLEKGHQRSCIIASYWKMVALVILLSFTDLAQAAISCQFEDGFCGWNPMPKNVWHTTTQALSASIKPPPGSIGMALASSPTEGWAELLSEEIPFLPFQTTFTFKVMQQIFAVSGANPYILLHIVPSDGSPDILVYSKRDQFTWSANVEITLQPRSSFRFRFRFWTGNGRMYAGVAGLVLKGEGMIIPATLPTSSPTTTHPVSSQDRLVSCTFRAGMCAWRNADQNDIQWTLEHGMSIGLGLPGSPDVSSDEWYAMVNAGSIFHPMVARLQSPYVQFEGRSELNFWYNIGSYGFSDSTTKLQLVAGVLSREFTHSHSVWESGRVLIAAADQENVSVVSVLGCTHRRLSLITNVAAFRWEFEFAAHLAGDDYVALDEIVWSGDENGSPTLFPVTPDSTTETAAVDSTVLTTTPSPLQDNVLTCSFANDLCGWSTETEENFQWNRTSRIEASPRPITGMGGDGMFLFAQGNSVSVVQRAHLISTPITLRQRAVLRFFVYNTAPVGDGVYVTLNLASGEQITIMRDVLNGANRWTEMRVLLDILNQEFSILIGAGVMRIRRFGLDEISFLPEEEVIYGSDPVRLTTTPRTTTQRSTPTPRPAVGDEHITCSFAFDLCGWRTHPHSENAWHRTKDAGVVNLPATASHQLADSWFISFRGLFPSDMSQGLLESQQFHNDRPRNLTFWYYKRGTGTAISYLGLRTADVTGQQNVNIWRHQGSADPTWQQTSVTIRDTGKISLVFYCGATNYIVCGVDEVLLEGEEELSISAFLDDRSAIFQSEATQR